METLSEHIIDQAILKAARYLPCNPEEIAFVTIERREAVLTCTTCGAVCHMSLTPGELSAIDPADVGIDRKRFRHE